MYHILKRVDFGERTFSTYHQRATYTLEEAKIILEELDALTSNRPNEESDDITDSYIICKDLPASAVQ